MRRREVYANGGMREPNGGMRRQYLKKIFHTWRDMAMVKSTQANGQPPHSQSMTF